MSRVFAFCFLMLAAVLGYLHIDSRPVWAPFAVAKAVNGELVEAVAPEVLMNTKPSKNGSSDNSGLVPQFDWLPDTGAPSVHAASLISLKDGGIRAFWFAGSREGAKDVVINSATYNSDTAKWSAPMIVMDRITAEKGLSRYIAKLGNPVPARLADGRMQLFFVTVSIGGWAGSSISTMISDNEGVTWGQPKRLITSPLINLSTLVKSPALQFADGLLGLPAYHEWIGRFGELLRLDAEQVIDKRRISSGRGAIQPVIFVDDAQQASSFFRQARGSSLPKRIPVSQTSNAGQSWQISEDIAIPNPNAAIAGLSLDNGTRVMVLNNIEAGRHRLVMVMRDESSNRWKVVQVIEDDEALSSDQRREYSYPYLISANGSDAHLVYTWDRKKIRHQYFSSAWMKQAHSQLSLVEQTISKEAQ